MLAPLLLALVLLALLVHRCGARRHPGRAIKGGFTPVKTHDGLRGEGDEDDSDGGEGGGRASDHGASDHGASDGDEADQEGMPVLANEAFRRCAPCLLPATPLRTASPSPARRLASRSRAHLARPPRAMPRRGREAMLAQNTAQVSARRLGDDERRMLDSFRPSSSGVQAAFGSSREPPRTRGMPGSQLPARRYDGYQYEPRRGSLPSGRPRHAARPRADPRSRYR